MLTQEEQRCKKWLTSNSPAHNALKEVVFNKTLLKDIRNLNEFCHTGNLEVYHSLMTKYCPKRHEFDTVQMAARTALVVLEPNDNTGQEQNVDAHGKPCYKAVFPKAMAKWIVRPVYEEKCYDYIWKMMKQVVVQQDNHVATNKKHTAW